MQGLAGEPTPRQREIIEAVERYGRTGASRRLGLSLSRVNSVWAITMRPAPRTCRSCGFASGEGHYYSSEHAEAAFWPRVARSDDHWHWMGPIDRDGYGIMGFDGTKNVSAHVYSWTIHHGPPRAGLEVDHVCRDRRCVRAVKDVNMHDHLQPVTHQMNSLRGNGASGRNFRKVQCARGHPLPPPVAGLWRVCVECRRTSRKAYYERKRDAKGISEGTARTGGRVDPGGADPAPGHDDPAGGLRGDGAARAAHGRQRRDGGTPVDW